MKEIPNRNYYILCVLIIVTVLLTLILANIYNNRQKPVSKFYEYANNISSSSFDQYVLESSDLIIYISDKYDLSYKEFEEKLIKKIDDLNLKNILVYMDSSELTEEFLDKFKNNYGLNIDIQRLPIIIVIDDKKVIDSAYVTDNSSVDDIIDYEDFE